MSKNHTCAHKLDTIALLVCMRYTFLFFLLLGIYCFNPLTPMSDQNRISLYNINTVSIRQVMRL